MIPLPVARTGRSTYRGWPSLALNNDLIEVQVVPGIGGRVIQLTLGGYEFLWVNDRLAGSSPSPTGLAHGGGWLNYGGAKLWPAPQGWDNAQQWPGPPDAVLDGRPHKSSIPTAAGREAAVQLVSRKDQRSGIQFSRVITVREDTSRVNFDMTMTNINTKPRRWGIWQVTQLNAGNRHGPGFNRGIRMYSPLNLCSVHTRGFVEMFGLINNPSFSRTGDGLTLVAHYQGLVGKVGMDNSAGWFATVDGTDGYVFVERFTFCPGRKYPDDTSVAFWLNGTGQFVCGKNIVTIREAELPGNWFVESEVISPYARLQPGRSYRFHSEWAVARIGGNYPVLDCKPVGVTCEPLTARRAGGKLRLTGRFGVFDRGSVEVWVGRTRQAGIPISPREPLVLDIKVPLPVRSSTVNVVITDIHHRRLGELARTSVI